MQTTASDVPSAGECEPRFAAVRAAFEVGFAEDDELGAALAVLVAGRPVVDLWGGHLDPARTRRFGGDTLLNAYSVGKGILAAAALCLVERGQLALDAPVATGWPAFAAAGKDEITLRQLLSHRAALPAVRRVLPDDAMLEWETMTGALAEEAPFWTPGAAHGYHVNTFGFLVGEVIARAAGTSPREAVRQLVTGPAGADFHFGLPEDALPRVAPICGPAAQPLAPSALPLDADADPARAQMIRHTYFNPPGLSGHGRVNERRWRMATHPSTAGHGTARAVAAVYDAILGGRVGGRPLIGGGLRREAASIHSDGPDLVLSRPSRFGLGFQLGFPERPVGGSPAAFGHFGYGGSLGFADPDAEVAFGYLVNRPGPRFHTRSVRRVIDAVYAAL